PRAALDAIALSDREMVAALDTTALGDSARAAIRRHAETIARRATLARRAEALSRAEAALLGVVVLIAAGGLVAASFWLVRRWSAQVAAPVEELVEWTRRLERGEVLAPHTAQNAAPEIQALRQAVQDMSQALDIARRREVERERLRAFRETARRVAHELRRPLGAAQLALRRLAGSSPGPAADGTALAVLSEEVERLKRMADEFAEFGRLPEGPEALVNVSELLESVLAATVPGTCPVRRLIEPALTLPGHYEALRRAVQNVVQNAVEATDHRGITVRAHRSDASIVCEIEDHGPGVPTDLKPRIFEPYVTAKAAGTGLGLAIAHQAVTAHGGSLTVHDAASGGAAFRLVLPTAGVPRGPS
ncbi:MAG TPA: HAMP domain-containing sensor histidine kinase, partial [Gemmatimonadales bacterium]|nr:HAMP domain-containing sensor histidine kinase [Gemmatimonadales bacterium]